MVYILFADLAYPPMSPVYLQIASLLDKTGNVSATI